jgi:hypothetical protein
MSPGLQELFDAASAIHYLKHDLYVSVEIPEHAKPLYDKIFIAISNWLIQVQNDEMKAASQRK